MKELERSYSCLPEDLALKIASSVQVTDLCALASCSRFWRQACASDHIWETLLKARWPPLTIARGSGRSGRRLPFVYAKVESINRVLKGHWKEFYIKQHHEMAKNAALFVERVASWFDSDSLEVHKHLLAVTDLWSMRLGFTDVEMFLFKPNLRVLFNLIGLHYCKLLKLPAKNVLDVLQSLEILERRVCVKGWKAEKQFLGVPWMDERNSGLVSLMELAAVKEHEVERVFGMGNWSLDLP